MEVDPWEHLMEQIGNFENRLGTSWEHLGNSRPQWKDRNILAIDKEQNISPSLQTQKENTKTPEYFH
jgi:hypothetical protein